MINKALPNAFAGTDLYTVFRGLGCDPLIIAELMPHICIGSTARAALDFGIPCKVVADACATRDLPESNGNVVRGRDLHRFELGALSDRFCPIADSIKR